MPELGAFFIFLSAVISIFSLIALFRQTDCPTLSKLLASVCLSLSFSFLILLLIFLNDRFDVLAVWQHSERSLQWFFKISAVWGGMNGSLLFWSFLHSWFCYLAFRKYPSYKGAFFSFASCGFYALVVLIWFNPFQYVQGDTPVDGQGLNPLLHNFFMLIHPIAIYIGLNSGAYLVIKNFSDQAALVDQVERLSWAILTLGIVLGGAWAYAELGWGGYWAWDPVENASLIPWLIFTAYLHVLNLVRAESLRIFFALCVHLACIVGTWITRSGIIQSVHAFANSNLGSLFLAYIIVLTAPTLFFGFKSFSNLKTKESSSASKLALVFSGLMLFYALSILWGMLFAPINEVLFGKKIFVGIPYYDSISFPYLFLIFLALAVGLPLVFLREQIASVIAGSAVSSFILTFSLVAFLKYATFYEIVMWFVIFLNLIAIIYLSFKFLALKKIKIFLTLIIHLGFIILSLGIAFSYVRKTDQNLTLFKNQEVALRNFKLTFLGLEIEKNPIFEQVAANIYLQSLNGESVFLKPASRFYFSKKQNTAEISLHSDWFSDVYLALVEIDPEENWVAVKAFYNPAITLVWLGAALTILGALASAVIKK
jgi:cytochrome c-type biogenesis protein CcmF